MVKLEECTQDASARATARVERGDEAWSSNEQALDHESNIWAKGPESWD